MHSKNSIPHQPSQIKPHIRYQRDSHYHVTFSPSPMAAKVANVRHTGIICSTTFAMAGR